MKINKKAVKVVYNLLKKRNNSPTGHGYEFDIFGTKIFRAMLNSGFDPTTLFLGNLVYNHYKNDHNIDSVINRIIRDIRFTYFIHFTQTSYTYPCSCNRGFYECDNCSSGQIECPTCPDVDDDEECPQCGGEGYINCSECEGSGEISCPDCDGGEVDTAPYVDIYVYAAYSLNNDVNNYIREKLEKKEPFPYSEIMDNDNIILFFGKLPCLSITIDDYSDSENNTICYTIDEKYHNRTFVLKQFDSSDVKLTVSDYYTKFMNIKMKDEYIIETEIHYLFSDESI